MSGPGLPGNVWLAILLLSAWGISELAIVVRGRARNASAGLVVSREKRSFRALLGPLVIALSAPFFLLGFRVGPTLPFWAELIGLALGIVGIGVREWALAVLGRYFTLSIVVRSDHHIVTDGPYRWVRHPSYTGIVLTGVGSSLLIGSVFGVILAAVLLVPTFVYRIRVEERVLVQQLGEDYERFRRDRWMMFPGIL